MCYHQKLVVFILLCFATFSRVCLCFFANTCDLLQLASRWFHYLLCFMIHNAIVVDMKLDRNSFKVYWIGFNPTVTKNASILSHNQHILRFSRLQIDRWFDSEDYISLLFFTVYFKNMKACELLQIAKIKIRYKNCQLQNTYGICLAWPIGKLY